MNKKIVVSNYNSDLNWLKKTYTYGFGPNNTIIYNRGNDGRNWNQFGTVIQQPNIGANQYDILTFIIDNYDNLPDITIFLKGNIFKPFEGNLESNKNKPLTYYTTEKRFIQTLNAEVYFSAWYNPDRYITCPETPKSMLDEGLMQQPLNYCDFSTNSDLEHRYFYHPYQVLDWCFVDFPKEQTIKFLPASNMALPKKNILNYSKGLYEKLKHIINYEPDYSFNCNIPAECYLLERIFYMIWTNKFTEK